MAPCYNIRKVESISNKKRKYSPIVWDRDDKVCKLSSSTGISFHKQLSNTFLSTGSFRVSTGIRQSGSPVVKSVVDVVSAQYGGCNKVEYEDCVELHDIGSCRWIDDVEEGEISDSPADKSMKAVTGEMRFGKKLTVPQFVERKREASEGKSSGSSDKCSNHSTLTDECGMEVDGQQNYSDSVGHLSADNDIECGFRETPEPAASVQGSLNMLQACRNVNDFENLGKLGEGTYGVVYKARNKKTGEIVALKKVKMDNDGEEGFSMLSLREIDILFSSNHPSIIDLKEVVEGSSTDCVFLVMEHMDYDLGAVLRRRKKQPFCQTEVKCLMLQLLQGVKYLHDNWVLHRDLKTSNLLVNKRGELKICDLGMARRYGSPAKPYTQLVVTLWYRAPELLLGAKQYSTAVDMWSVGCIMAELLLNQPLFDGSNEINQIHKIFRMLGTPNETSWPGFSELPKAKARLLRCDPAKRITAEDALDHQWFQEFPLPKFKDCMPTF
ncbi:cyclin-dependent kinase G-2-like isoform X2 [Apium graveolens]|uniref:cyclin-dependent kinase G-2-like isoform X2 n=1 Tax=Apium graveolens TaxID=4045 RepID=UPI003D7B0B8E